MIESLETRRLLASASIVNGKLRIEGTAGDDNIAVGRSNPTTFRVADLNTNTFILSFNPAEVRSLSFAGLAGNDIITLGQASFRSYMDGGDGDDSLSCSNADKSDTLLGGEGSDYLYGGPGNDYLDGGVLDDTMLGNAGDDYLIPLSSVGNDDLLSGGDGNDTMDGSDYPIKVAWQVGNENPNGLNVNETVFGDIETIIGTAFDDEIYVVSGRAINIDGGGGNDTIITGRGNDTITGGAGTDSIDAAGGNDLLLTLDTETDTLQGGSGTDTSTADAFDVLNSIETQQ